MANRNTIGVIIDTMDGRYQTLVSDGLMKEAANYDFNLLFFSGIALKSEWSKEADSNTIFGLPNKEMIDGIILVLSSLEHYTGEEGVKRLSSLYTDLPIVSVSIPIEGTLSIMLDNREAMNTVIEHVLTHVDITDIAYISGSSKNSEARDRLKAYTDQLERLNIKFNEDLCYEGDFSNVAGSTAVDYFNDKNEAMPKAIVAANDEMAIGAYLRLTELGYKVPGDVIVTGFDNIDAAQDFFPPITTFDQHSLNMSKIAIDKIYELINGETAIGEYLTVGDLIIRESCGCSGISSDLVELVRVKNVIDDIDFDLAIDRFEQYLGRNIHLFESMVIESIAPFSHDVDAYKVYVKALLKGLLDDIQKHTLDGHFVKVLNEMANYAIRHNNRDCLLQEVVVRFRGATLGHVHNQELHQQLQDIYFMADTVMGDSMRRKERHHQYYFRRMYLMSRDLVQELNQAITIDEITRVIKLSLPMYGISQCYMNLYDTPQVFDNEHYFVFPDKVKLVLGYNNHQYLPQKYFKTRLMLPGEAINQNKRVDLLFLSLFREKIQYGYIVFSVDGIDPLIYETLRTQISAALKRQEITKSRIEAEKSLNNVLKELELSNNRLKRQAIKDELTGLNNRRGFYEEAEQYFNYASIKKEVFYAVFGDIDGLKQINDSYGHDEGDFAIIKIASLMKEVIGNKHIIARMSGDEFTLLIKNTDDEISIKQMIDKIEFSMATFNDLNVKPYKLSISLGYAVYNHKKAISLDDLLRVADTNLYREKSRKKLKN